MKALGKSNNSIWSIMVNKMKSVLGNMQVELNQISPKELTLNVALDTLLERPVGFIQTRTLDYTDESGEEFDVHRTGILMQEAFGESNVPFYCLGYPPNLYTHLDTTEFDYPRWRVTIKTFLVEVTESPTKPIVRYKDGFSWGLSSDSQDPLPLEGLTLDDWLDATARLNYECPGFTYLID